MNRVYQAAVISILAVAGKSANDGIPGVKAGTRGSRYNWNTSKDTTAVDDGELVLTRPSVHASKTIIRDINDSTYSSRGWIFQEKLLSRRCIIFCEHQTYFQCQAELFCEKHFFSGKRRKKLM